MNKKHLTRTATVLLIAIIAFAAYGNAATAGTMTTAMEGELNFLMAGTGEAVIDWGDGSVPDTVTLSAIVDESLFFKSSSYKYKHIFSDTTSRTIVIDGQNIMYLECNNLQLTALDVSNNTALHNLRWFKPTH